MHALWKKTGLAVTLLLATAVGAEAANVRLVFDASYRFNAPFGLAFDGTNIHWSDNGGTIREMTTNGVLTGRTTRNPSGWSELAWDGRQLLGASGRTITFFDRYTAGNQRRVIADSRATGFSLVDGLDFDNGEIWFSPDVGRIYRLNGTTGAFVGAVNPIPVPPNGGFSGVERIDTGCPDLGSIIIVVNDAFNPRRLTVASLTGTRIGETTLPNSRYEGLAFDGTHLYAADYLGNKIDKIRVFVDDCQVSSVPEPGTLSIAGVTLLGLMGYGYRRRQKA